MRWIEMIVFVHLNDKVSIKRLQNRGRHSIKQLKELAKIHSSFTSKYIELDTRTKPFQINYRLSTASFDEIALL